MARRTLMVLLLLAGCSDPLAPAAFDGSAPAFDPVAFWTGHTRSWGVIENRDGSPSARIVTDCVGEPEGDGLRMAQTLTMEDGSVTRRDWHMRRLGGGRFSATANDMVGEARGEAHGRLFHWTWALATRPGTSWRDVTFEQWMYAMDGGTMVNRTMVTKLGVVLAEVTEQFAHTP